MTAASGLKDTAPLPCDASSTFKVESLGRKIVPDTNQLDTGQPLYYTTKVQDIKIKNKQTNFRSTPKHYEAKQKKKL